MAFLRDAGSHHHARVRRVVTAVCASIDEDIRAGKDVLAPVNPVARRLEAIHAIHHDGTGPYFNFSAAVLAKLSNSGAQPPERHQHRISKAEPPPQNSRISKSVPCSSSSRQSEEITTTTAAPQDPSPHEDPTTEALIFPKRLQDNQRALAMRYLAQIPEADRQAVLDELTGRLEAEQQGAKPVYDPVRYLNQLCIAVKRRRFHPNLGVKVYNARTQRAREVERQRTEDAKRQREREQQAMTPRLDDPLKELRTQLGLAVDSKQKAR